MATLEGGLRDRMILESVLQYLKGELTTLGWFTAGRQHEPITIVDEYPPDDGDVAINTMAFSFGDISSDPMELGGPAETIRTPVFIDFFGENDGLGRHIIGDLHTIVAKAGQFTVYDYTQTVPSTEFVVQLEDGTINKRKPTRAVNSWQKNWYVLSFIVSEERANA